MTLSPRNSGPDFLGRLVDTALGRGDALQPRLPSLFEPGPGAAVAAGFSGQDEIAVPPAEESEPPSSLRDRGDTPRRKAARPAKGETAARETTGAHEPKRQAQRISQFPDGVLHAALRPTMMREAIGGALGEDAMPHMPVAPPPTATLKMDHDAPPVLPARDEVTELVESRREAPRATVTPAEHPVAPAKAVAARRPPTHRIVVEPATAPHRPAGDPMPVAADPAPVINVTIGRVEVRAVQTPPAPRRPNARGPRPMTLDEYLKQRGGGQ